MNRYDLNELNRLYFSQKETDDKDSQSHTSRSPYARIEDLLSAYTSPVDSTSLQRHAVRPCFVPPPYTPLADQVFGRQLALSKLSLRHLSRLLADRTELYSKGARDLDHRHMQIQEELSIARMLADLDGGKRALNLERLMLQLEQQKRQEQRAFWKEATELKQLIFEKAGEYASTSQRAGMLSNVEMAGQGIDTEPAPLPAAMLTAPYSPESATSSSTSGPSSPDSSTAASSLHTSLPSSSNDTDAQDPSYDNQQETEEV